jgi:hypothetical protein
MTPKSPDIIAAENRIAELEKMLAAAQTRKALATASTEPALQEVLQRAEEVQARITSRARFWSGNANQTFQGRKRSHKLWLDEIDAQERLETVAQQADKIEREDLKNLADKAAGMIAQGQRQEAENLVRETLRKMDDRGDSLQTYQKAFELSQTARKAYTAEKTAPTGRPRGRPRRQDEVESEETVGA